MPVYVINTLHKLQHPPPTRLQHYPHQCMPPKYVPKVPQRDQQMGEYPSLAPADTKCFQQVVGMLL